MYHGLGLAQKPFEGAAPHWAFLSQIRKVIEETWQEQRRSVTSSFCGRLLPEAPHTGGGGSGCLWTLTPGCTLPLPRGSPHAAACGAVLAWRSPAGAGAAAALAAVA